MSRVRALRDHFVGSVLDVLENFPAEHRLTGHDASSNPGLLRHTTIDAGTSVGRQEASIAYAIPGSRAAGVRWPRIFQSPMDRRMRPRCAAHGDAGIAGRIGPDSGLSAGWHEPANRQARSV
jgi:hypothetical protein